MRLFFDENLSFRLVAALADVYHGSLYVRDARLLGVDDRTIWAYPAEHRLLLISKDADFYERSVLYGAPPTVNWLQIGTSTVRDTADLLLNQYIRVRRFSDHLTATFLSVIVP